MGPEEAKDITKAWFANRRGVAESLYTIAHKVTNQVIPYRYNSALEYLVKHRSTRDFVLKSRQLFITTFFCQDDLLSAVFHPNFSSLLLCNRDDDAKIYYDLYLHFYRQMPEEIEVVPGYPVPFRPKLVTDNIHLLEFEHPEGNSYLRLQGVQALTLGRGFRINNLHAPEYAYWDEQYAKKGLTAALGAMSPSATSHIETTANGATGAAFDLWQDSKEGKTIFKPIFLPWYLDDTATLSPTEGRPEDKILRNLSEHELRMMRDSRTENQIRYYRWAQAKFGDLAKQELAEDEVSCWIQAGRTVLAQDVIDEFLSRCVPPLPGDPALEIYQHARPGTHYILGIDVMEGVGSANADNHCIFILNPSTYECCGIYASQVGIPELVAKVAAISSLYNNATAIVERNSYGAAVLEYLEKDFPDVPLYRDDGGKLGWHTNQATKPLMVESLKRIVYDRSFKCFSKEFWNEARGFLHLEHGRIGTKGKSHDDRLMAAMVAISGAEYVSEDRYKLNVSWR